VVTGLPGTGKSTLAWALASRYRLPILAKDAVKEPLFDVIGAADRAASRNLSDASFAVMFSLARACLGAGTDLILEGNFRPGEHESAIEALIVESARRRGLVEALKRSRQQGDEDSTNNARGPISGAVHTARLSVARVEPSAETTDPRLGTVRIAQVLCLATEDVRLARLKLRATDPTRHPGHRDAALATDAAPATLDFLTLPGERLVFSSDARLASEVDSSRLQSLFDTLDHWHGPKA
jgi:predicted kinase